MEHQERSHSLLSPSGAHRWLKCTPSVRLEDGFPETTSPAAEEGTLAHELAELKLINYFYPISVRSYNAKLRKMKTHELWDEEMMGHTETYLDYIKSAAMAFENQPYVSIEQKVSLESCIPEGAGLADCVLVGGNTLHVIDFKYGKSPNGRVSAEENPQLMLYALGAYEIYKVLYDIHNIKISIVQPRLPEGISEWGCPLGELLEFQDFVSDQAKKAWEGEGDFLPSEKTCKYCKAKASCRARAEENVKLAFVKDTKPPLLKLDEIGAYLEQGADVASWLKDVQEYALAECLKGFDVPGWKAVEGRGSRAWVNEDEAIDALIESGISKEILFETNALALAKIEKAVGAKEFKTLVGDKVIKTPGKPTLAKKTDKRAAITNKVSAKDAFVQ